MEQDYVEVDFTGHTAKRGGGLSNLSEGDYAGKITGVRSLKSRKGDPRLYVYYSHADGSRVRDSFGLSGDQVDFFMGWLETVGFEIKKLIGRKKLMFDKLIGKWAYYHYVPARKGEDGKTRPGSFAEFSYSTKEEFGGAAVEEDDSVEAEAAEAAEAATATPAATPATTPATTPAPDDFSFLDED